MATARLKQRWERPPQGCVKADKWRPKTGEGASFLTHHAYFDPNQIRNIPRLAGEASNSIQSPSRWRPPMPWPLPFVATVTGLLAGFNI
jgi:hypothetical protein